ncbi:hypothetical protein EVAR_6734_1 [Eumeta japonica]|uniref:Uncharacterized protein n=1 Tax=Eumeta variegata TaxID=151549 RepID=A0A4C1V4U2_EUMVA|nr:hypothetical protein EVAR_6734_1 [Eumeta japonica]
MIIEELRKFDDGLRFVACVPKSQKKYQTKVVLNTNTYDEKNETWLDEMERCISIGSRNSEKETIKVLVDSAIVIEPEIVNFVLILD